MPRTRSLFHPDVHEAVINHRVMVPRLTNGLHRRALDRLLDHTRHMVRAGEPGADKFLLKIKEYEKFFVRKWIGQRRMPKARSGPLHMRDQHAYFMTQHPRATVRDWDDEWLLKVRELSNSQRHSEVVQWYRYRCFVQKKIIEKMKLARSVRGFGRLR